jgi:2,3-bisphosphoglycerate-independent phosphoglycerate mutase
MSGPSNLDLLPQLVRKTDSRILFVVLDGLGGVLGPQPTALQRGAHPHLDELAADSALGRCVVIGDGITPGSGPGHFAVFGYDPFAVDAGRGLLEALGLGVDVQPGDVAARGNYCTLDAEGLLLDRRAGRIPTERSRPLAALLNERAAGFEDVGVRVYAGLQHRFAVVFRGPGLEPRVADTDPQRTGVAPFPARVLATLSQKTARVADAFVARAREVLGDRERANGVLLRGFSGRPVLRTLSDVAGLRACAVAAYPAYRGVARLLGMDVREDVESTATPADQVDVVERVWQDDYDFVFLHVKGTDSAGEDGDEERKAAVIDAFDSELPRLRALRPDVIVITGDHSTPGPLAAHSWHPVPALLWGPWCEPDAETRFDEEACHRGRLGPRFPSTSLLPLALANAGKLEKFGA